MKNRSTKQAAAERAAELVSKIIRPGDDEAAGALAALVSALAGVADEGARQELATAVAERAYARTNHFGDAVLALMAGAGRVLAKGAH